MITFFAKAKELGILTENPIITIIDHNLKGHTYSMRFEITQPNGLKMEESIPNFRNFPNLKLSVDVLLIFQEY